MSFHCTECGLCCQHLDRALDKSKNPYWMHAAIDLFPHQVLLDGSCEKLVDNRCSVYEDRPLLCNVSRAADEIKMPLSRFEWYKLNYDGCEILQREVA